jgi:putative phosphoribosyl transferase
MGAISYGGGIVVNQEVVDALRIPLSTVTQVAALETAELKRRENSYRKGRGPLKVEGKTLILVDDGLATGSTILAALKVLRPQNPKKIIVGVPVTPASTFQEVRQQVDDMVCLMTPEPFYGVGQWYEDFSQTSDREVNELLKKADTFGSSVLHQHEHQIS